LHESRLAQASQKLLDVIVKLLTGADAETAVV